MENDITEGKICLKTWLESWDGNKDELVRMTGEKDYPSALLWLFNRGCRTSDMERFGLMDAVEPSKESIPSHVKSFDPDLPKTMPDSKLVNKIDKAQSGEVNYHGVEAGTLKVRSAVDSALHATFEEQVREYPAAKVKELTETIDPVEIAVEIGGWITKNVEQFIDNRETVFRMYLNVQSGMNMPMSSLFQKLYLSVPDVDEVVGITADDVNAMYDALDAKLDKAKEVMSSDEEFLNFLFERMVFFYELTGLVLKDGKIAQTMVQKLQGSVSINELAFDPISLMTTVAQGVGSQQDGKIKEGNDKVVIKQEESPAGFGIELEILVKPKDNSRLAMY